MDLNDTNVNPIRSDATPANTSTTATGATPTTTTGATTTLTSATSNAIVSPWKSQDRAVWIAYVAVSHKLLIDWTRFTLPCHHFDPSAYPCSEPILTKRAEKQQQMHAEAISKVNNQRQFLQEALAYVPVHQAEPSSVPDYLAIREKGRAVFLNDPDNKRYATRIRDLASLNESLFYFAFNYLNCAKSIGWASPHAIRFPYFLEWFSNEYYDNRAATNGMPFQHEINFAALDHRFSQQTGVDGQTGHQSQQRSNVCAKQL